MMKLIISSLKFILYPIAIKKKMQFHSSSLRSRNQSEVLSRTTPGRLSVETYGRGEYLKGTCMIMACYRLTKIRGMVG
jgi:hypothetical protein